jgi:hypothetical protein
MLFKGTIPYDLNLDAYMREPWFIFKGKSEKEIEEML